MRRAALAVLLDIRREAVHRKPAYTLLLAMNAAGRELLRTLRPALPVVTKPARAAEAGPEVKAAFAAEVRAMRSSRSPRLSLSSAIPSAAPHLSADDVGGAKAAIIHIQLRKAFRILSAFVNRASLVMDKANANDLSL